MLCLATEHGADNSLDTFKSNFKKMYVFYNRDILLYLAHTRVAVITYVVKFLGVIVGW